MARKEKYRSIHFPPEYRQNPQQNVSKLNLATDSKDNLTKHSLGSFQEYEVDLIFRK